MTSRFSTLQNRDARPLRVADPLPVARHEVVLPTRRAASPAQPEV